VIEHNLNAFEIIYWMSSNLPEAELITEPIEYINIFAVKKLIV